MCALMGSASESPWPESNHHSLFRFGALESEGQTVRRQTAGGPTLSEARRLTAARQYRIQVGLNIENSGSRFPGFR